MSPFRGSANKKTEHTSAFDVTPIVALPLLTYDRVPFAGGINLYLDSLARKGGCQSAIGISGGKAHTRTKLVACLPHRELE